ncbi:MAG: sigma-54 dependent transcriptional regulator [Candidatus Zixiibacteriota bacterium]
MNIARPRILYFGEDEYDFLESGLDSGRIIKAGEASLLLETLKQQRIDIILFDSLHPQYSDSLIQRVYRKFPSAEFWVVSDAERHIDLEFVVDAIVPTGLSADDFEDRVFACLNIRERLEDYKMVGKSHNLKRTAEMISQVAPTDISTLIIGPSGAGKELVARAVHQNSKRANKPYIAVNCGAFAETLLESELFGYEKGAFTGAIGRREGIFKRADGGTVFLDEIGETSPALQVRLLRVLEEGTFYRVGGDDQVRVNVRVVAATNRELLDAIQDGDFREDLYFRLGAMRINLAGLADRKADILPLINFFFEQETGHVRAISARALDRLIHYGWPGNVRQLRNFVNRMIVTSGKGEISEHHVMQFLDEQGYNDRTLPVVTGKSPQEAEFQLIYQALLSLGQEVRMLRDIIMEHVPSRHETIIEEEPPNMPTPRTMDEMEQEMILNTLESVGGNRREAAKKLGIGERTLYRKLKKYGEI